MQQQSSPGKDAEATGNPEVPDVPDDVSEVNNHEVSGMINTVLGISVPHKKLTNRYYF